jgi:hypothetical protein
LDPGREAVLAGVLPRLDDQEALAGDLVHGGRVDLKVDHFAADLVREQEILPLNELVDRVSTQQR